MEGLQHPALEGTPAKHLALLHSLAPRFRLSRLPLRSPAEKPVHAFEPLLQFDFHTHPRVDAALEHVLAFGEPVDLQLASLKDSGPCHRDLAEAARTLGSRRFSVIQAVDKGATELLHS